MLVWHFYDKTFQAIQADRHDRHDFSTKFSETVMISFDESALTCVRGDASTRAFETPRHIYRRCVNYMLQNFAFFLEQSECTCVR